MRDSPPSGRQSGVSCACAGITKSGKLPLYLRPGRKERQFSRFSDFLARSSDSSFRFVISNIELGDSGVFCVAYIYKYAIAQS